MEPRVFSAGCFSSEWLGFLLPVDCGNRCLKWERGVRRQSGREDENSSPVTGMKA